MVPDIQGHSYNYKACTARRNACVYPWRSSRHTISNNTFPRTTTNIWRLQSIHIRFPVPERRLDDVFPHELLKKEGKTCLEAIVKPLQKLDNLFILGLDLLNIVLRSSYRLSRTSRTLRTSRVLIRVHTCFTHFLLSR